MASKNGKKQVFNSKREPLFRCPFPGCGAIFAKEPGKPETCLKHRTLISDVLFILDHTRQPEPVQEPADQGPKILVPKPGMADQAIAEELKRTGGQP